MKDKSENIPAHIAIIMDGNGRWALQRGLERTRGHLEGVEAAKRIIRVAIQAKVPYLSLYAFSTENWKRSKREVSFIMGLVSGMLRKHYSFYVENNVRIVHSGNAEQLSAIVKREIGRVVDATKNNTAITLNLAINYGGKDEIVRAVNRWLSTQNDQSASKQITEADIASNLDLPEFPPVDLLIRSSGEQRFSNFLLWESAYAELYYEDALWPDWTEQHLALALEAFAKRKRNFGA